MTASVAAPQGPAASAQRPTLPELRERFRAGKAALLDHFRTGRASTQGAVSLLRALARHVDETLALLWAGAGMPASAALLAVGGYGRGELFPYSDVDVLVLLPDPAAAAPADAPAPTAAALQSTIESFITACWDIGLEIGSSVRTLSECLSEARADVTVQTALLEARLVTGQRRLFNAFRRVTGEAMDAKAFLRAKTFEMRQRQVKYEDTPYSLEPNCKESPGGLRDLQVVTWIARAAGLGRTWSEMAANGLLTPFEVKQLQRHEGTLKLIRARLHVIAGRREDRLVFDLQTAVAESFGYAGTTTMRASEKLMQRYYWAAKAVAQLNQVLLLNLEERINGAPEGPMQPINERFLDRSGLLEIVSDDLYLREPHAILETFLLYATTEGLQGLSARTLRALYNVRNQMNAAFRRDPVNRARFVAILQASQRQTHVFRLMNQTSVLGRYLWVFRRIVGRMQHDLFHVYTVDQHILMVLRNVRRFFIPEHAHEYPKCTALASSFERPWVLYVAALFHDVAKGRGGDHSELGGVEVRRFCKDHGIGGDDAALVEFLVRHHLTMSNTAQKADLSDAHVITEFAALVQTPRRLTALYLLTVADIRGTSPKVWNAWKGKLLEDLFRLTMRALGGDALALDAEIEARKKEARQILALHSALPGTEAPLWKTLDLSYFARHDPNELAWHARSLWRHLATTVPVVRARPAPHGEGLQVLLFSPDREDLFARICGYFDGAGFSIQDAKIHTTHAGFALDTFQVVNPAHEGEGPAGYRDLIPLVEHQAAAAAGATGPLPTPRASRVSRRVKWFPVVPRVSLRPDERAQRWLLSISASDRSGLLYAVARVLAQYRINLQLAKVSTLGERVEDTFLVDGAALQNNRLQIQVETEILEAISAT
ncbi:MAG: [protein-PII] uridylyltransferase [Burkholderiaceae bacterium]